LQASLEEKDALLKEVHHRVKNDLQLINSLLSLQAARIPDRAVAELFAESRNRVRSMALVHENLYRAGNFARIAMRAHIQNLAAHLIRAYGLPARHIELTTEIDDIELDLDRAVSIGLIINELVSNAFKHAFPAKPSGSLRAGSLRAGSLRAGSLRVGLKLLAGESCALTVTDDGIGLPVDLDVEHAATLGLQLVHDLTQQLHGSPRHRAQRRNNLCLIFDADRQGQGTGWSSVMELSGYVLETFAGRPGLRDRAASGSLVSILVRAPAASRRRQAWARSSMNTPLPASSVRLGGAAAGVGAPDGHRVLVLEDAGGDLGRILGQPLEPGYFLRLAIAAAGRWARFIGAASSTRIPSRPICSSTPPAMSA
jgi:two-component sensor histidine kinase